MGLFVSHGLIINYMIIIMIIKFIVRIQNVHHGCFMKPTNLPTYSKLYNHPFNITLILNQNLAIFFCN